ncbi:MAG: hypothetical protein ACYC99_14015 [Candidatus Geothermincolia bacterium]
MTENEGCGQNPEDQFRNLSYSDQLKFARTGSQTERTILERLYGKGVWEALLANPQISVVEVARIACKGGLSQHLLDTIVGNQSWLANAQVRRGLLTNPRLALSANMRETLTPPEFNVEGGEGFE